MIKWLLTTGRAADAIGVNIRTLQGWLKRGVVSRPSYRLSNGAWAWSSSDIARLRREKMPVRSGS
jgi:predicted site-specific integrase-resolvase